MTREKVMELIRRHAEGKFPLDCSACGKRFITMREYVRETQPVGPPISYDAESGDWHPSEPIGTVAFANCPCGNTLAVGSEGMPLSTLLRLMAWARVESFRQSVSLQELLASVRAEIDRQILAEEDDAS